MAAGDSGPNGDFTRKEIPRLVAALKLDYELARGGVPIHRLRAKAAQRLVTDPPEWIQQLLTDSEYAGTLLVFDPGTLTLALVDEPMDEVITSPSDGEWYQ